MMISGEADLRDLSIRQPHIPERPLDHRIDRPPDAGRNAPRTGPGVRRWAAESAPGRIRTCDRRILAKSPILMVST